MFTFSECLSDVVKILRGRDKDVEDVHDLCYCIPCSAT
jgi:hypothetical protein